MEDDRQSNAGPRRKRRLRSFVLLFALVVPELAVLQDLVLPSAGPWATLALFLLWQVPLFIELRGLAADREATLPEMLGWQIYYAGWTGSIMYASVAGLVRVVLLFVDTEGALAAAPPPAWLALVPFALASYGVFVRQHAYPRRDIEIALPSLPECWVGTRIVHLSDIHVGRFIGARRLARLVRRAASASADIVVITGDTIDSNAGFAPLAARHLSAIPARLGVFAVLGNHDHYSGGPAVRRALEASGIRVLTNEGVLFHEGGAPLYLAGIDDLWHGADLRSALAGRPPGVCTVLLSHQPTVFPEAAASGVALVLAGHTHGGQIAMPYLRQVSLARLFTRFVSGLYRLGDAALYVSNGAGVIRPLARVGAAPEIAQLVLVAGRP